MSLIEFENNEDDYSAIIKVVGVGGGGTNAVNSMVRDNIRGCLLYTSDAADE